MLSLFGLAGKSNAAPSVSGVSGTLNNGQTLTIIGSYLVDEDKTNWASEYKNGTMYGFEGTSYIADGYADAPDDNPQERGYDSDVKLMGSKSFKGRIYGTSSGTNHSSGIYVDNNIGTDLYVRLYSRWKSTGAGSKWPESHIKMLDVQGDGGVWQCYLQPDAIDGGAILPTQINMVYGGQNHLYGVANFLQEDRWYCMEARFKSSSPANFTAWVDGVQIDSVSPSVDGPWQYILFNMINARGFTNLNLSNWTDNFTISSSRIYPSSKIEIGNSSNYTTATKVYQEPLYLSDGSVQIKADLAGLGSGPYYLWVTNNKQERSAVYNLSGSTDETAPSTPSGLSVL